MSDQAIDNLRQRVSTDNRIIVASGTLYTNPEGFFMEVKAAGSVKYTTMGGQVITETMTAGYHPFMVIQIWATTAVEIAVNY